MGFTELETKLLREAIQEKSQQIPDNNFNYYLFKGILNKLGICSDPAEILYNLGCDAFDHGYEDDEEYS